MGFFCRRKRRKARKGRDASIRFVPFSLFFFFLLLPQLNLFPWQHHNKSMKDHKVSDGAAVWRRRREKKEKRKNSPSLQKTFYHNMEKKLWEATASNRVCDMRALLQANPSINVNSGIRRLSGDTALHLACFLGHLEVIQFLLTHPDINVNQQTEDSCTQLYYACIDGRAEAVRILLEDPRVDINLSDNDGWTPLWRLARAGHLRALQWLIALRGHQLDLERKGRDVLGDGKKYTAFEIARLEKRAEVTLLLKKFKDDRLRVCHEVRVVLGVQDALAAELFAITIFLCDDYLRIKKPVEGASFSNQAAIRFFSITVRLPMELQMVVCHRVCDSAKESILSKDSEVAFKSLGRGFSHSEAR